MILNTHTKWLKEPKHILKKGVSMKQIVGIIEERIGEIYEAAIKEGN